MKKTYCFFKEVCKDMKLTLSQTRYLIAIYKLSRGEEKVRSVEIAEVLGVSRPSVSRMLKGLIEMGLLQKRLYGTVLLTDAGKMLAEGRLSELKRLEDQLLNGMDISPDLAEECALLLLPKLPDGFTRE